jgi:hypothetical protein
MIDFPNILSDENFYNNDWDFDTDSYISLIPSPFSNNFVLNDEKSLSSKQYLSYNDSLNNSKKDSYNSSSFINFQKNNSICEEIKYTNKEKKKSKKEEDNNIKIKNNNRTKLIGKKKPPNHDKTAKDNIRRKHDKTAKDNIKRKIQVNYINFLLNLLNQINFELLGNYENNENIKFFPLNYNFKKQITKKGFDSLKTQTLGYIFKNNVSPKFNNYQYLNIKVYNEITNKNKTIKNILDKKYLEFFDVYYYNKKTLNLSKYGLDKTIILSSDIGFFKDLLKKDDSDSECSSEDDIYYQKRIEECIKRYFMRNDKPIFFVKY